MRIEEPLAENLIIWAIDPFQRDAIPDPYFVRELQRWTEKENLQIQPVYVLALPKSEGAAGTHDAPFSRYVSGAEQSTAQYLQELGVLRALPPRVLFEHSSSLKLATIQFLGLAEESNARMLVVSSRGRSGVERVVFGSFAENLLSESQLPVLILNQARERKEQLLKKVLFPTDFSENSQAAFDLFLMQAKSLGYELILYHEVIFPLLATSSLGAGGMPWIPDDYMKEQASWAQKEGANWLKKARDLGIACRCIVSEDSQNVSKNILGLAEKERVSLIALASHSGPLTAVIVGSVAREVVRAGLCPVWVCGPKSISLATESKSPERMG